MKIIIPSYKRPGLNPSIDNLPEEIVSEYVYIAVRDEEYEEYVKAHPGVKIHNLGKGINGIVETRQRINEQFSGKILVIDDDNVFHHTEKHSHIKKPENGDFIRRGDKIENAQEFLEFLEYTENLLDKYPFGSMRNLNFVRDARWLPYTENSVCYWVYFFNLDTFDYENCSFRNGPPSGLCEDTYLFLDWFDKGNDIFVLTKWNVKETSSISCSQNAMEGGCNTPDRGIRYKNSMIELNKMFPQYTTLKESKKNTETYGFPVPTLKTRLNPKKRVQSLKTESLFDI